MSIYNFRRIKGKPLMMSDGLNTTQLRTIGNKFSRSIPDCNFEIVVEFKTEAEGVRLAKLYKRLADNPKVNLNVIFKKIIK